MGTLIGLVAVGTYGFGVWKFWSGFKRTQYASNRLGLALMWPVLLAMNKTYRRNFSRALKGGN